MADFTTGIKVPLGNSPVSYSFRDPVKSSASCALFPFLLLSPTSASCGVGLVVGKVYFAQCLTHVERYMLRPRGVCMMDVSPLTPTNVCGPSHRFLFVR